jgi:hypothetical protein
MIHLRYAGRLWPVFAVLTLCVLIGCVPPPARPVGSTTTGTANVTSPLASNVTTPLTGPVTEPGLADSSEPIGVDTATPSETVAMAPTTSLANLVPIDLELPAPAFKGTPVPQTEPNVEKPMGKPRPPFLAPEGTVNLALGQRVTASDPVPISGELDLVTDGDKEASDFGYLATRAGSEWVQVDLGQKAEIYAVVVWHNHADARVYRDVIVQVSDDPDFLDAHTVFNNDYDNTSGMGIGTDMGYVETSEGKLINCKGLEGRFVRLYSKGSTVDDKNHYTEVSVYGRPAA